MSAERAGRIQAVVLALALGCLVVALWRLVGTVHVEAASAGQPIMIIQDERDAGAKDAEPTIYILWPGQKKVEAYSSDISSFITYDFATRKVIHRDADVQFTGASSRRHVAEVR